MLTHGQEEGGGCGSWYGWQVVESGGMIQKRQLERRKPFVPGNVEA